MLKDHLLLWASQSFDFAPPRNRLGSRATFCALNLISLNQPPRAWFRQNTALQLSPCARAKGIQGLVGLRQAGADVGGGFHIHAQLMVGAELKEDRLAHGVVLGVSERDLAGGPQAAVEVG